VTDVSEQAVTVRYEGGNAQTELWGGAQANFVVSGDGEHQHEVAVLLPEAVASYLAQTLGRDDSAEFHMVAAREAGAAYLESLLKAGKHIAPFLMLARAELDGDAGLLATVKARLHA